MTVAAPSPTATPLALADLARESAADLRRRYDAAPHPADLRGLDGDPTGRMLAVSLVSRTPLGRVLRAVAARPGFVWEGKSFWAREPAAGEGINRVRAVGLGRQRLFPFATRIGPSALDGAPAVVLDYDRPENPAAIRRIHDEVREVAPGVWLGPAMWKTAGGPRLLLWFALARSDAA